jgi:hypothetical protein
MESNSASIRALSGSASGSSAWEGAYGAASFRCRAGAGPAPEETWIALHPGYLLDAYQAGRISFAELDASVKGWVNHVRYADTWGLREHLFAGHPIPSRAT